MMLLLSLILLICWLEQMQSLLGPISDPLGAEEGVEVVDLYSVDLAEAGAEVVDPYSVDQEVGASTTGAGPIAYSGTVEMLIRMHRIRGKLAGMEGKRGHRIGAARVTGNLIYSVWIRIKRLWVQCSISICRG